MSRRFEDPSLAGMRVLEVWANQDDQRRFEIVWRGPKHADGVGGYRVAVWTGDAVERRVFHLGRTLHDAALEATRNAE